MTNTRYNRATEIGLAISDRISKAGLAYIKKVDPELYREIKKANRRAN